MLNPDWVKVITTFYIESFLKERPKDFWVHHEDAESPNKDLFRVLDILRLYIDNSVYCYLEVMQ